MADFLLLIHPAIAVAIIFPFIGIVVNRAWQTRSRRLETLAGGKSRIPPIVGQEHVQIGFWLAGSVFGISLIGLAYPIFSHIINKQIWTQNPPQVLSIVLLFAVTIAAYVFLHFSRQNHWRTILAILSGAGIVFLGFQDGVFRRDNEWYSSHFYYGITATLLMIFSVAILPNIYQDRSNRWRYTHVVLNLFALLLFIGQGLTGVRDLLEIPPSAQKPYIKQLYMENCFERTCTIKGESNQK